jgi:prepilin-type N-terminal cleavage/methylation domain-containing protein
MNAQPREKSLKDIKGFTLTELAIVLGVIGIILGAVWASARTVYQSREATQANAEILALIQGINSTYANTSVTGDAAGTDETGLLSNAGVLASDMNATTTPWGTGTGIRVTSQTASLAGDSYAIELNGVPTAGCDTLLLMSNYPSSLYYINATITPVGAAALPVGAGLLPVTVAAATAACNASVRVSIQLGFKLRG